MARKAEKEKTKDGLKLKIVNPNAAGIDIAYGEMQVCVPEDRDGENNRCFGSFTCDYEEIASWLKACGITTVAMESTGSYWVGLYFFLEEKGFDVLLANAKDVKNVSGKKTDEADAEWIMLMHSYGLLKPSFHPDAAARSIRELARHRDNMLRNASKEVQHMQKSLVLMNIKVDTVISDILGKSGKAIIEAILNGNHDPKSLVQLVDPRCKASKETIEKSLEGTWDVVHLFELKQSYDLYKYIHIQIADCEAEMDRLLGEYTDGCGTDMQGYTATKKRVAKKNAISFDAEKHDTGHESWCAGSTDGGTRKRIHRKVHVGQELLQVVQPRSEQQNLRWQTSLEQGAQAEEQSRTGVQAMCQLSKKCQDGTRYIFQEAEVQRWSSASYCSDRE